MPVEDFENAQKQLKYRRLLVRGYAEFCGFSLKETKKTASAFEQFSLLGKEDQYRSLYSALSSQVHADAESLIDYILTQCIEHKPEEKQLHATEMGHWMGIFLVAVVITCIEACEKFAKCFAFNEQHQQIKRIRQGVENIDRKYHANFIDFQESASAVP